jgi:hypothetical protein
MNCKNLSLVYFLGLNKMNRIRLCNYGQHLKNNQCLNGISSSYNLIFFFL